MPADAVADAVTAEVADGVADVAAGSAVVADDDAELDVLEVDGSGRGASVCVRQAARHARNAARERVSCPTKAMGVKRARGPANSPIPRARLS